MDPRTTWAIRLGPTGNLQGSYKFLSLATRKKVPQRKFTDMPITEFLIEQVERWLLRMGDERIIFSEQESA
jgi:hypothetical protein